jgi:multiple sugar transport system ATP-binding protein
MSAIELREVTKQYTDGTAAVEKLSLEIADGEFMILVGPSGCGKTTTLRMLAGLEEITEGEARIGERVVNHLPPKERDIAMVFQNYALYPHMTVRQNMGFALKLAHVDRGEITSRVEEAARILDLGKHLDRKPRRLSGGQRQRVAMGRAIVRDPQAFLMDEPLSNLDAKLRVQMRTELARLQAGLGTTTVFVTHDQTEAMTLGHRVAVMHKGILQQVDTPLALYRNPANLFVAGFIGSPAMNLIKGELSDDGIRTPLGMVSLSARLRRAFAEQGTGGREVVIGVRPEDLHEAPRPHGNGHTHVFEVAIELTESVGPEVFAHFELGDGSGTLGVARLDPDSSIRAGQRINLGVDTSKLHLFEAGGGHSLLNDSEARPQQVLSPSPESESLEVAQR